MKNYFLIILLISTGSVVFGQNNLLSELTSKTEIIELKSVLENQLDGEFLNAQDIELNGKNAKSYTYRIGKWQGIGACKYISYYCKMDTLIGYEFYFIPATPKSEILDFYPNNKLLDTIVYDINGVEAVNSFYEEYSSGMIMSLSAYKESDQEIVVLTFFKPSWIEHLNN